MWVAGFDPGGSGQFGWCVAEASSEARIAVRATGVARGASHAVEQVLAAVPVASILSAVGIDSPLYWSTTGDRVADVLVRRSIRVLGCATAGGTVQHVNSLRGACLVQGLLTAHMLHDAVPGVRITESHPKALLWLMGIASPCRLPTAVGLAELGDQIAFVSPLGSEHERDAALGALAAAALLYDRGGWRDLRLDEREAFLPVPDVEYWMPLTEPPHPAGAATPRS